MQEFFINNTILGNSIFKWILAVFIVIVSVYVAKKLYKFVTYLVKKRKKADNSFATILIDMLREPLLFAMIIFGIWYALETLTFSDSVDKAISVSYYILIAFDIAWFATRVIDAFIVRYVVPFTQETETELDDHLLPLLRKFIKATIWVVATLMAINNAGYNVGAIIASLGIGGLAFALAAKDTIANLFGSFTIFLDEPFKLGERVKIDNYDGYIEEIGIRSTRLRLLNGRVVTISNTIMANSPVENISSESSRRVILKLSLTYNTTSEQIREALSILENITKENELLENLSEASFIEYGDFALVIRFAYYIKKESNIFLAQSETNLKILEEFNKANLEFAYPTQTIILDKN